MYSISIDYLFNRVYDVLLWFKYVWLFVLLRKDPSDYIAQHMDRTFDGLRDRGWFDAYLNAKNGAVLPADIHVSLWQKLLEVFGVRLRDSDGDGIPDITDQSPYDPANLTGIQLKERYQADYTFMDKLRDAFGLGPVDSDHDGVPDSYETAHHMDPNNPDTDRDGVSDGVELAQGTDPLNSDTDGDLVLDGRDAYPLDPTRSVAEGDVDSDGDGIGDKYEKILGTDPHNKDTDGDGIPDNMDTYPLDPNNIGQISSVDIHNATQGIHFAVQNPVLALFTDLLSILTIAIILVFAYVVIRWFITFVHSLNHFDHYFDYDHHSGGVGHVAHVIKDTGHYNALMAAVPGLAIQEETPTSPPTVDDFNHHPRFAIIQGYMSSPSEALWRIGILEADNMLLEVLREKGYAGSTVADMLKSASFKTVQLAWGAHGIRNRIAHEGSDFQLTEREAKRAFILYESVFQELKVIM